MNLAWHIARKDIRRFWAPVALLCAIAALRFGVGASLLLSDDSDRLQFLRTEVYANLLLAIWIFVTYLLVAAIVHEDAAEGPAFWQTRPISGLKLLAGKALGLFLMLGLLPVLVSIPWWLACGFGGSEICRAAAETLAVQMGVVVLALPLAAVTREYGRFLLWTVVGVVAFLSTAILSAGQVMAANQLTWAMATRMVVIGLIAAAGGAVTAIHQFLTRRTWRSIAIIAATGLSMAAAHRWWTPDGSAIWSPRPNSPVGIAKDLKISFRGATEKPTTAGKSLLLVNLLAESVPPDYILRPFYSEQRLRWTDGSISKQLNFSMSNSVPLRSAIEPYHFFRMEQPAPNREAWQYMDRHELIPLAQWNWDASGQSEERFPMVLSAGETGKLASETPDYDGTLWFRLFKPELIGERSLSEGCEFAMGSIRTRVAAIRKDERTHVLHISLVESAPESPWSNFLEEMQLAVPDPQPSYYAINRARTYVTEGLNETRNRVLIAGVAIFLRRDAFRGHTRWNETSHKWETEPDNLDGGTLAEVNYRQEERFSMPLSVGKLQVNQPAPLGSVSSKSLACIVTGEVSKAGELEVPSGANLVTALRLAGGVSDRADLSAVTLTRTVAGGAPATVVVDVEAWLENPRRPAADLPLLQPGDVINVPAREAPPSR
jgi:hypothetical protein